MVSRFWRTASPDLESKKVEDLGVPEPEYVEDQTLDPGVEKTTSKGSSGSRWETYKVVYKDGKEISRELDHKTTYKGHKPVVHRNTSGVVLNPEETTTQATTVTPTVDGMPEGYTGLLRRPSPSLGQVRLPLLRQKGRDQLLQSRLPYLWPLLRQRTRLPVHRAGREPEPWLFP